MRFIHIILIVLLAPYILLVLDQWPRIIHQVIFGLTICLSTPGLLIAGIFLCADPRKKIDVWLGIAGIIIAILYIGILFWVFSANDF